MQNIGSIIRPIAIAEVKKPIAIDDKEIDLSIETYKHLIDQEYRLWHIKWIKRNGLEAWIKKAKIAEQDGRDKARYFTFLLKKS